MFGSLPVTLLSALAWTALVNAAPTDPTITPPAILPRQADAGFIGWLEDNGTWSSQKCDNGLTWYQNGKYAQCCPDSVASCNAPTACVAGSQIYPLASTTITTACTGNYNNTAYSICNTAFIFESFGDSNPKTDIVCGDSSVNWSYYRKIPATATEKSSALPSSVSVDSAETGAASPTQSSAPSGGGGGSKAWIAGAVIGPIVGIALIAGIIFFLMRRKKNKSTLPATGGASMGGPPPGVQQPYTDAKPQLSPDPQQGQTSPAFNQQDAYNHQGFYGQQPTSPAPQYAQPYGQPNSPPPQNTYTNDVKYGYSQAPTHPEAAELGGGSNPAPAGQSHTAELPSDAVQK